LAVSIRKRRWNREGRNWTSEGDAHPAKRDRTGEEKKCLKNDESGEERRKKEDNRSPYQSELLQKEGKKE